ncbi:MAG: type II secretion system protein [Verrucomicrobiota bacterium]
MKTQVIERSAARKAGYTLIEVMVAAGLLLIGISAASSLTLTMTGQEEINRAVSRTANLQENYIKAYHLGLTPAEITAVMPPEPSLASLNAAEATPTIPGVGAMESATWNFFVRPNATASNWSAGMWTGGDQGALRTMNFSAYRSPTY